MQKAYGTVVKLLGGNQDRADTVLIAGSLYLAIILVAVVLTATASSVAAICGVS